MQGFYDNLGDTSWWMSVVFVGLGLNLLAAYLKWPIDTIMSKLFTSWTRRLEAQNQFRAQLLEKAVEDSPLQLLMAIELLRLKVKILYSMFLGIVFLSMASSFSPELSPEGAPHTILWGMKVILSLVGTGALFSTIPSSMRAMRMQKVVQSFPYSKELGKL